VSNDYLTREQMVHALERLGTVLHSRGLDANLYVVGGAAMAFAYKRDRVTRDIDAIVAPNEEVFAAAREVGEELKLPEEWINDTARAFLPDVRLDAGTLVFEAPGISVRAAPAEVLLAMKILAGRTKDLEDIRMLAQLLELNTAAQVTELFLSFYPQGGLIDHSTALIEELFPGN
jgi:predicted nucleotidyltransferase